MMTENPGAGLSEEVINGTFALAREGRVAELKEMIQAGVPVDTRNARSDTMLIVAAYAQQAEAVAALLELGADHSVENTMGQTAVACAVFRNDEPILQMLLDAGADPDLGFRTAHEIADQFQLTQMTAVLLKHAAR